MVCRCWHFALAPELRDSRRKCRQHCSMSFSWIICKIISPKNITIVKQTLCPHWSIPCLSRHVALDRDLPAVVTSGDVPGHISLSRCGALGRGTVWPVGSVCPLWSPAHWLLSLWEVSWTNRNAFFCLGDPDTSHLSLFLCRYLVTFSNVVDNPNDPENVIVWDILTGEKKRTFTKMTNEEWPTLKWVWGIMNVSS